MLMSIEKIDKKIENTIKVIFPQNNQFTVQFQSQDYLDKISDLVESEYHNHTKLDPVNFICFLLDNSRPLKVKNIYGDIPETTVKFTLYKKLETNINVILYEKGEVNYKIKGPIFSDLNKCFHETYKNKYDPIPPVVTNNIKDYLNLNIEDFLNLNIEDFLNLNLDYIYEAVSYDFSVPPVEPKIESLYLNEICKATLYSFPVLSPPAAHNINDLCLDKIYEIDNRCEEGFPIETHFDTTRIENLIQKLDGPNPDLELRNPNIELVIKNKQNNICI